MGAPAPKRQRRRRLW